LMSVRTFIYLNNLRDGNSNKIYPSLDLPTPVFRGKPVKVTTQIPVNLSGSNTELMLLDASQQLIGQNPRINIAASTEGSYKNAAGQQVNAFERNETILRIVMWNDINTMHPESIAVLTGVTY
jgi:HK97 family phage major capsid protein